MTSNAGSQWDVGSVPLVAPEALTDIVAAVADMAVVIDADARILSVLSNPFHGAMTDLDGWGGRDFRELLTTESVPKFDRAHERSGTKDAVPRATEINHLDPATKAEFPISYTLHRLSPDGATLLLGRDLRPIADLQQQLVNAQIAVERDYERQRGFDTRFRVLMHATPAPIVFIAVGTGRIDEVNGAAASLLGRTAEELKGSDFAEVFEDFTQGELNAELATAALADGRSSLSLTLKRQHRRVAVKPSFFRAGGTRMLLCRLEVEDPARQDAPAGRMEALFAQGSDAIVFTDAVGRILSANDAFSALVASGQSAPMEGAALADHLDRGTIEQTALLENITRSGRIRTYATRLKGGFDALIPVDLSATRLDDPQGPVFAFVIRDSARPDSSRTLGGTETAAGPRALRDRTSVVDLVGSTSLRDIVADTTDVIEKMCIEMAIDLTDNNRAAAAEMLGLSRQSLYVKLRKFDLLGQPDAD